jgi:hypothetical protein
MGALWGGFNLKMNWQGVSVAAVEIFVFGSGANPSRAVDIAHALPSSFHRT